MKTVKIPNDYDPYIVEVNGKTYKLPAGATMSVPDEVAAVINNYYKLSPKEKPVDGGVLPFVTDEDNGKVLGVVNGVWSTSAGVSSGSAVAGQVMAADGNGGVTFTNALPYITTAPTADNTNGIILCVLSEEPAAKYNGYIYIITE